MIAFAARRYSSDAGGGEELMYLLAYCKEWLSGACL